MSQSPRPNSIQRGLRHRDDDQENKDDRTARHTRIRGRIKVIAASREGGNYLVANEATATLDFPVTFMERPSVSFGWELDKASYGGVTAGYLPAANSGVAQWVTKEKIPGVFHYTGAVLIITTQNNPHTMWIHWQAEGKAFVNPS